MFAESAKFSFWDSILQINVSPFFSFLSANFHIVGWTGLLVIVGRVAWKISPLYSEFVDNARESRETIHLLATNHFPHLQAALDKLADTAEGMREEMHGAKQDVINALLLSKNN